MKNSKPVLSTEDLSYTSSKLRSLISNRKFSHFIIIPHLSLQKLDSCSSKRSFASCSLEPKFQPETRSYSIVAHSSKFAMKYHCNSTSGRQKQTSPLHTTQQSLNLKVRFQEERDHLQSSSITSEQDPCPSKLLNVHKCILSQQIYKWGSFLLSKL